MNPVITIGLCTRNSERTVGAAIESIIAQDYPHDLIQIIFVDGGSIDRTLQILTDYAKKMDIKAKIYRDKGQGLGPARNVVIRNAVGKYILWVDADEVLTKNYLKKQVEFMEENPEVGITAGLVGLVPGNLVLNLELIPWIVNSVMLDRPPSFIWKTKKVLGTSGATFRTKALRQANGFDNRLKGAGEDMDVAIRIRNSGWLIKGNYAPFYEFHNGMSTFADLWKKYYWYGQGCQTLYVENREAFSLPRMTPLAGFITGVLLSVTAYKIKRQKSMFLLPLHYCFKTTAWTIGFINSQIRENH